MRGAGAGGDVEGPGLAPLPGARRAPPGLSGAPAEGRYPSLWRDATSEKARDGGRVQRQALVVAYGVHEKGIREVLAIDVGAAETEACWREVLRSLVRRGLAGVEFVVSDAHEGLKKAIGQALGCPWQRCTAPSLREALGHCPKDAQGMVAAAIRPILNADMVEGAISADEDGLARLVHKLGPELGGCIEMVSGAVWVRDRLAAYGREIQIAEPRKVKALAPLACKTDRVDARVLAELVRRDLAPEVWVPSLSERELRERLPRRTHLVRLRASATNRTFGPLAQRGLRPVSPPCASRTPSSCRSTAACRRRGLDQSGRLCR